MLLIWPTVESGINDDWSLARTAEFFAHTGRIAYNGWEAPMLLWQTVTSGLLMRIFGFSYLVVRLNTAVHGLVAVVLLQRCCVRSGLSEKLATFVTLVFALCPVFLGCAVMGMTDVVGLLALITCYYGCLRAVQASTDRASALWLCFAVVSDLVLSTTRQLDFIGVVVLVPCTLYILRRKRSLVLFGAGLLVLSAIFIALVLHWFNRQPYIPSQSILPEHFSRQMLPRAFFVVAYAILDSGILIFPACLLLLPAWKKVNARTLTYVAGIFLLFTIAHLIYYRNPEHEVRLLAPFFLITFYDQAVENTFNSMILPPKGTPPVGLSLGAKILLTSLSLVAATSFLSAWFLRKELPPHEESVRLTWKRLLILTVPLLVSLLLLLLPRGVQMIPPDRYLLSFFPFALILLARYRSRRFGQGIPRLAVAALAAMALYSVATIHDLFAVFRANLTVIQELEASGVPRENIDGGWEYNYETQV
ncbi:MAG TPA: hypothetical protein VKV05_14765, partial [Terriglobales bacterium]|nr:hypothetical protein [Terriglobales bacterium]